MIPYKIKVLLAYAATKYTIFNQFPVDIQPVIPEYFSNRLKELMLDGYEYLPDTDVSNGELEFYVCLAAERFAIVDPQTEKVHQACFLLPE